MGPLRWESTSSHTWDASWTAWRVNVEWPSHTTRQTYWINVNGTQTNSTQHCAPIPLSLSLPFLPSQPCAMCSKMSKLERDEQKETWTQSVQPKQPAKPHEATTKDRITCADTLPMPIMVRDLCWCEGPRLRRKVDGDKIPDVKLDYTFGTDGSGDLKNCCNLDSDWLGEHISCGLDFKT